MNIKDINKQIKEEIKSGKYEQGELDLFIDNYGYQSWMDNYTEDDEYMTEREEEEINNIIKDIWDEYFSEILKSYIEIAENLDWSIEVKDNYCTLETYTPYGQDAYFEFDFDGTVEDFVEQIGELYGKYDVSEEVRLWTDASGHGRNGAPYELEDIIAGMKYIENALKELFDALVVGKIEPKKEFYVQMVVSDGEDEIKHVFSMCETSGYDCLQKLKEIINANI